MPQSAHEPEREILHIEGTGIEDFDGIEASDPEPAKISMPRLRVRSALSRSPRAQHLLSLAIALAEEDVIRAHVWNASELLAQTAREAPFDETLAVYMRVLDIPRQERRLIRARALAALQERLPPHLVRRPVRSLHAGGILDRLTRRLRGRRHKKLRARIAAATAQAQEDVRLAYLAGADRAVAAMDGLTGPAEAVQLFLEKLDVTADWGERIFHDALIVPGAAATMMVDPNTDATSRSTSH